MADKQKILIQLDTDPVASTFDRVVAIDSGAEHIFTYAGVTPEQVTPLIHGAIFTRGPADLKRTAVFIGGSDVTRGEEILETARRTFLGSLQVSLMLDSNGANTTAAAAVLAVARHADLAGISALVLGGTGPVGRRVARLLVRGGAKVRLASRTLARARDACQFIESRTSVSPTAVQTATSDDVTAAVDGVQVVIAAAGAGVTLLDQELWAEKAADLSVVVDLNAVPPTGISAIEVMDRGQERDSVICYGALGVGGTKMKIHKAAVTALFLKNDQVLDAEEILEIGRQIST